MTPTEIEALGDERRVLESLTRLERQWLKRRFCGWCERSCLAESCGARNGYDEELGIDLGEPCDMDARRAVWLKSYKPRAAIARAGGE